MRTRSYSADGAAAGPVARWPGGPVARWPGGPVARWPGGPVARGAAEPGAGTREPLTARPPLHAKLKLDPQPDGPNLWAGPPFNGADRAVPQAMQ